MTTELPFQSFGPKGEWDTVEQTDFVSAVEKSNKDFLQSLQERNRKMFLMEQQAARGTDRLYASLGKFSKTAADIIGPQLEKASQQKDMEYAHEVNLASTAAAKATIESWNQEEETINQSESVNNRVSDEAYQKGDIDIHLKTLLENNHPSTHKRLKRLYLSATARMLPNTLVQAAAEFKVRVKRVNSITGEVTYPEITRNQTTDVNELAQIDNAIWEMVARPFLNENQGMVRQYLYVPYQKLLKIQAQNDTIKLQDQINKKRSLNDKEDLTSLLNSSQSPAQDIINYINLRKYKYLGGGQGSFALASQDAVQTIKTLLENDEITIADAERLNNYILQPGDIKGQVIKPEDEKTLADVFPAFEQLEDVITEEKRKEVNQLNVTQKYEANQAVEKAREYSAKVFKEEGRLVSEKELFEKFVLPWMIKHKRPAPQNLLNTLTQSDLDHEGAKVHLAALAKTQGGIITEDDVKYFGPETRTWAENTFGSRFLQGGALEQMWQPFAAQASIDVRSAVRDYWLGEKGEEPNNQDAEFINLENAALEDLKNRTISNLLGKGETQPALEPNKAYKSAREDVIENLKTGYVTEFTGPISLNKAHAQKVNNMRKMIDQNPLSYQTSIIPGTKDDLAVLEQINRGNYNLSIPSIYTTYAGYSAGLYPGVPINGLDVASTQYKLATGNDFKQPISQLFINGLDEAKQRLLKYKAGISAQNRVIVEQSDTNFDDAELTYEESRLLELHRF